MPISLKNNKTRQWLIFLVTVVLFSSLYYSQKNHTKKSTVQFVDNSIDLKELSNEAKANLDVSTIEKIDPAQNFIKSYQGTQPDGAIHLDENGNVIIDKDLKRLFDYYLSAIGELPLDQMRKYLQEFASEQLTPEQLEQLLQYFDQYHNYLTQADVFFENMGDGLSLQEKMQLLSAFRLEQLGLTMSDAFFADEQNYIEYVLTDRNSDEMIEQQLAWLQAENQATAFQDVVIENQQFINENTNPTEVYQYRVEQYGQEAADRLSQLDQQRAQWQSVVDTYVEQRQQIDNQQSALSLEQLHSNYTAQEIRRLQALWRIRDQ